MGKKTKKKKKKKKKKQNKKPQNFNNWLVFHPF